MTNRRSTLGLVLQKWYTLIKQINTHHLDEVINIIAIKVLVKRSPVLVSINSKIEGLSDSI